MANCEGAKAGFDCLMPLPYNELNAEKSKLPTGTVQPFPEIAGEGRTPGGYLSLNCCLRQMAGNLIKLDKAQPGSISHRWDKCPGRFVIGYTLSGDACPSGEKQITFFLVAPANVGRHISSSQRCRLLSAMECGEDSATVKWYVEQMRAEAEAIEGRCQWVDGQAVEFRLFGFDGDQKFFDTVAEGFYRPGTVAASGTGGEERELEYNVFMGSQPDPFAYERGLTSEEIALTTHIEVPGLPALVIPGGIRDYIDCCVAFIEGPKKFFVQLQSEASKIQDLQTKMQIFYQSDKSTQTNTLKGSVVAAKFYQAAGGDDNWYRAVVTDRRGLTTIEIFFVDYGNKIEVTKNEIKTLPAEYRVLPAQAIACVPWDVSTLDKATLALFQTTCESQESIIRIEGKTSANDAYAVTLFRLVDGKEFNMNDALCGRGNYPPVEGEELIVSAAPAQPATALIAPLVNPFGRHMAFRVVETKA